MPSAKRGWLFVHPKNESLDLVDTNLDREVTRCMTCGLVQYRTRTGNCRRCLHVLPRHPQFVIPKSALLQEQEVVPDSMPVKFANRGTVEHIGLRIRQLRESRTMTQSQLQMRSKVSRSYLSRIESGQMTPSLGTLEKIADALTIGFNRFFIQEVDGVALLEDLFIQSLCPYLQKLQWEQWVSILKRLRAIGDYEDTIPATLLPIGRAKEVPNRASAADDNVPGIRVPISSDEPQARNDFAKYHSV